jgi:hypothetical protein
MELNNEQGPKYLKIANGIRKGIKKGEWQTKRKFGFGHSHREAIRIAANTNTAANARKGQTLRSSRTTTPHQSNQNERHDWHWKDNVIQPGT